MQKIFPFPLKKTLVISEELTLTNSIVNIVSILSLVLVPFLYGRSSAYVVRPYFIHKVFMHRSLLGVLLLLKSDVSFYQYRFNFASIVYYSATFYSISVRKLFSMCVVLVTNALTFIFISFVCLRTTSALFHIHERSRTHKKRCWIYIWYVDCMNHKV